MLIFVAAEGGEEDKPRHQNSTSTLPFSDAKLRVTVVLDKTEHIPALMTISRFLQTPRPEVQIRATSSSSSSSREAPPDYFSPHVSVDAIRLIELTERTSGLMKSAMSEELMRTDSLLNMYRAFGDLHDLPVSSSLSIVSQEGFPFAVADHAQLHHSDLVVLSWLAPGAPGQGIGGPAAYARPGGAVSTPAAENAPSGPFDALFRGGSNAPTDPSMLNTQFVRRVFAESTVDVALYVDRSCARTQGRGMRQHILLPFFGGPDDRLALAFVVQLCAHPYITATIVRMTKTEASEVEVEGVTRPTEAHTNDSSGNAAAFLAAALRNQNLSVASRNDPSIVSSPDLVQCCALYGRSSASLRH